MSPVSRVCTGLAPARSTYCPPGAAATTWRLQHECSSDRRSRSARLGAAGSSDSLGRTAADVRFGERARAPRSRGIRLLVRRTEERLSGAEAVRHAALAERRE